MILPLLTAFIVTGGLSDSQVLQRNTDGFAQSVITGTADVPGRVQCSVDKAPWQDIAQIDVGTWKAALPKLKTGGPYALHLRLSSTDGRVIGEISRTEIYVGDLWILAGQSNMVGRAKIEGSYARDPRVRMLSLGGVWQLATHPLHAQLTPPGVTRPGYGPGLEFGRTLAEALDVPIGLLICAKGGTSLEQWSPDLPGKESPSLYGNMLAQVRLAGGSVAGMVWYQGENDTGQVPSSVYKEKFKAFVARVRSDLQCPDLPFLYAQLARFTAEPSAFYSEWNVVREAQRTLEDELSNATLVATIDLENSDYIHLSRASQDRLGRRFALAAQGKGGPRFVDARWVSPDELRLRFKGASGDLKSDGRRVLGFEATDPAGRRKPTFFGAAIDEATHEIVLFAHRDSSQPAQPEAIDLWYGRGHDPVVNITDRCDLALPAFGPVRLPPRPRASPRAK